MGFIVSLTVYGRSLRSELYEMCIDAAGCTHLEAMAIANTFPLHEAIEACAKDLCDKPLYDSIQAGSQDHLRHVVEKAIDDMVYGDRMGGRVKISVAVSLAMDTKAAAEGLLFGIVDSRTICDLTGRFNAYFFDDRYVPGEHYNMLNAAVRGHEMRITDDGDYRIWDWMRTNGRGYDSRCATWHYTRR